MKRGTILTTLTALLALWTIAALDFMPSTAEAAVPRLINFQGILKNGSGNPVANGPYFVTFRIYGVPSGGTVLYGDTQTVATSNGLFNAIIGRGASVPDTVFNDTVRYLGISVFPDGEMSPRQRLGSVGYAYESAQWTSTGQDLFRLNGNVGIGTNAPDNKFVVNQTTEGNYAAHIQTSGLASSYGLVVSAGTSASDVSFNARNQAGTNLLTVNGAGNVAIGTAVPFYANTRLSVQDDGSPDGEAVYGYATGTNSHGVVGEANNGPSAAGVFGSSSSGYGVYGISTSRDGVVGVSTSGYSVYAVKYGPSDYAGFFSGNVYVSGTINKGAVGFKIDHPLDPSNKYLHHSGVESPDMMNIYNGNVTLDSKGEAVIALPDWFGALNKDFRYQLTAIGAPGPNLYIAQKVSNNQFRIAGGTAGMEISWQVTGIRQDAYANAHRIPVEEMKADKERGYYLHPDLFGQPEEKGTEWAHRPEMMKEMKERRLQAEKEKKISPPFPPPGSPLTPLHKMERGKCRGESLDSPG